MRDCNWLQGLEGDLDTSHLYFLHSGSTKPEDTDAGDGRLLPGEEPGPEYVSLDTDYGAMYGAYRPAGEGSLLADRAVPLPLLRAHPAGTAACSCRIWVPMDDHHTMFFNVDKMPDNGDSGHAASGASSDESCPSSQNTTDWYGRFRTVAGRRERLPARPRRAAVSTNFTGIAGILIQDHAVTESMGPVLDRTNEHVGTSDMMVIRIRRRLIEAARALVEHKVTPPGVDDPEVYRTRSASCVLPEDVDWLEASEDCRRAEY